MVAAELTDVAGSSDVFAGGVAAYSNRIKHDLLGVSADLLDTYGAVSVEVAQAMADGARERLGVDAAVAVTGVAGPGGGTPEKPVGLVHLHVSSRRRRVGPHDAVGRLAVGCAPEGHGGRVASAS